MSKEISLGIDFGSTGYRLAAVMENEVMTIPPGPWGNRKEAWTCLEISSKNQSLSLSSFKSFLNKPGKLLTIFGEQLPSRMLLAIFQEINFLARNFTNREVGQLVIAVPATYTESRRAALIKIAEQSGFSKVRLVNDAIVTAMGYHFEQEEEGISLVYDSGYEATEIAVIRNQKQRYSAIAYGRSKHLGGKILNESILAGCIQLFESQKLASLSEILQSGKIFKLLTEIIRAKELLSVHKGAFLPLESPKGAFLVPLFRSNLDTFVVKLVEDSCKLVEETLKDAKCKSTDIVRVILAGGTSRMPIVGKPIAAHFPNIAICEAAQNVTAIGAAAYAANLMGIKDVGLVKVKNSKDLHVSATNANHLFSDQIIKAPINFQPMPPKKGSREQASQSNPSLSGNLFKQIETSLQTVPINERLDTITQLEQFLLQQKEEVDRLSKRNWRIKKAYSLLKTRQFDKAINQAHLAWSSNPNNYEIMEEMIEIHRLAALSADDIEGYDNAVRWLHCGLNHDEGNMVMRNSLADRHFLHAQQLIEIGEISKALQTLKTCLVANQGHFQALELKKKLEEKIKY